MCMAGASNMVSAPMNAVGGLWGDNNLGEKSIGFKAVKAMEPDEIKASTTYSTPTTTTVGAQQRRSILGA